jgi:hypothetical protein
MVTDVGHCGTCLLSHDDGGRKIASSRLAWAKLLTLSQKQNTTTTTTKRAGSKAEVIQCLPSVFEVLGSYHSTGRKNVCYCIFCKIENFENI